MEILTYWDVTPCLLVHSFAISKDSSDVVLDSGDGVGTILRNAGNCDPIERSIAVLNTECLSAPTWELEILSAEI
jgi:hypothetical protein